MLQGISLKRRGREREKERERERERESTWGEPNFQDKKLAPSTLGYRCPLE